VYPSPGQTTPSRRDRAGLPHDHPRFISKSFLVLFFKKEHLAVFHLYQVAIGLTHARSPHNVPRGEERKQFFFEKKNQKTFAYKAFALPQRLRQMGKSFCFFFQKEVLSCVRWVSLKATRYYS
jgi:hypothetical protein